MASAASVGWLLQHLLNGFCGIGRVAPASVIRWFLLLRRACPGLSSLRPMLANSLNGPKACMEGRELALTLAARRAHLCCECYMLTNSFFNTVFMIVFCMKWAANSFLRDRLLIYIMSVCLVFLLPVHEVLILRLREAWDHLSVFFNPVFSHFGGSGLF